MQKHIGQNGCDVLSFFSSSYQKFWFGSKLDPCSGTLSSHYLSIASERTKKNWSFCRENQRIKRYNAHRISKIVFIDLVKIKNQMSSKKLFWRFSQNLCLLPPISKQEVKFRFDCINFEVLLLAIVFILLEDAVLW